MGYTDPITVAVGDTAHAADWNTYLRDNERALGNNIIGGVRIVGTGGGFGERWHPAPIITNNTLTTLSLTIGSLFCYPLMAPHGGTLDRIAFSVSTGGSAGSVARAGIYATVSDTDPYPGALVVDGGEITTTTTGVKAATINTALLPARVYWVCLLSGVAAPTVHAYTSIVPTIGATATDPQPGVFFQRTQTYGALPGTFPSGPPTSVSQTGSPPAIQIRFSA